MSSKVVHELCVAVGSYKDSEGKDKKRWQKVGIEMETDQGGRFILLDRWFNPAGIADPENRGTVMLSMFDPKSDHAKPQAESKPNAGQHGDAYGDDIPW